MLPVPLERPRSIDGMRGTATYQTLFSEIWNLLRHDIEASV